MVSGTTGLSDLDDEPVDKEDEEAEKSPVSTSCKSGSQPTLFHVVHAVTPPGFSVRCNSRTPWTGEGEKAKSARAVKERSNVSWGNERDVESMIAVSISIFGLDAAAAAAGVVVVVVVEVVLVVRGGEVREGSKVWL